MTDIAEGLRTFLLADATIAGLVGARLTPQPLPQGSAMPALTYLVIDQQSVVSHDGASGLANPVFQIDCWGATYPEAVALFTAVRERLNGHSGSAGAVSVQGIFLVRMRDLYDNESGLHRRTADFSIWNEESV